MKKILFTCLLAASAGLFGQSIISDNIESLTLGNLNTDITGTTPGQGGWYTVAPATAPNSAVTNFQIVDNGAPHGKVVSILGSNSTTGTKAINQNNKLTSIWPNRTPGNDILQYEFDVFSGPATASQNTARVYIWDATAANRCLIGFALNQNTKQYTLIAYSNPCQINGDCTQADGNWGYTFNTALSESTWYKVGIAWNYTTGQIYLKVIDEASATVVADNEFQGAAASATPTLANIQVLAVPNTTVTSNTVGVDVLFDNISLKATDVVSLLGVSQENTPSAQIKLYPNPTSDYLTLQTSAKINSVQIFDMSGRAVAAKLNNQTIDVRNLAKGNYIIKIDSENGVTSQKFIKK